MGVGNIDPEFDILRDQAFYMAHEAEFLRDYPGEFVAIRGEEIFWCVGYATWTH